MRIGRVALAVIGTGVLAAALGASEPVPAQDPFAAEGEDSSTLLGIVPQRDVDGHDIELMSRTGVDSIRVLLPWTVIEPERGSYDWSAGDEVISAAAKAGLIPLPFLSGTPKWAWELDGRECSSKCSNYAPSSPPTRGAFAQFASAAVRRYGPDGTFWEEHPDLPYTPVGAWQIWNEQNSPFFYRPAPDAYAYAALLERVSQEIRSVDPDAEVVLGGIWSLEDRPSGVVGAGNYLRRLYRIDGVEASFDGIAIHPYDGSAAGALEQVRTVRRVARRAGDGSVGLWVTELGWAASGKVNEALVKGRRGQARMLKRVFGRLMRSREELRLRGAYWFAWRDTERGRAVCSWCAHSGLLSRSGRPRPAYEAMRALAERRR